MNSAIVQSVLRHLITAAGAMLAKELITRFDFTQDRAQSVCGALMIVGSAAWSIYQKAGKPPSIIPVQPPPSASTTA